MTGLEAEAAARAAKQHYILPVTTWSATMSAYCYTELCPDRELRMRPADWEECGKK